MSNIQIYKKIDEMFVNNEKRKAITYTREYAPHLAFLFTKIFGFSDIQEENQEEKLFLNTPSISTVIPYSPPALSKKIKVQLLCNWCESTTLTSLWKKMCKDSVSMTWNNIQLVTDGTPDYYVVVNTLPSTVKIEELDKKKIILLQMEPNMAENPKMWGIWSDPDEREFFACIKHNTAYNNCEWHISKTYSELISSSPVKDASKDNVVSTVLSSKYRDPGQMKRIDFVKFLEGKSMNVDVYGDNKWKYKNYKGNLPYHCKENALFPYKYTFNAENHSIKNYFTEKLIDGILSECLVFYNGCFNAKEYIDERAFVYLELVDFEKDYNTIKKAIEENWWEQRLPYIRQAKKKILEELQLFPRLEAMLDKK